MTSSCTKGTMLHPQTRFVLTMQIFIISYLLQIPDLQFERYLTTITYQQLTNKMLLFTINN